MKIEILRCFEDSGIVCGEYYVEHEDEKYLCFQNGADIQLLVHWYGKDVKGCVVKPTKKVVDMVLKTSKEYLSTNLKLESVTFNGEHSVVSEGENGE